MCPSPSLRAEIIIAQVFFFFLVIQGIKETKQSYKGSFGPPKTGETIHTLTQKPQH